MSGGLQCCYDPGPTKFSSPSLLPLSSPSVQHIPAPPEPTIRPPMPRPLLPQQPPPQFPMYQTYQTPLSWDTPTWPPPELLVDISLDQDTDMTTTSPASPSPEVYMPLDHVQPDPPTSIPIVIADPPISAPTITSDLPAPPRPISYWTDSSQPHPTSPSTRTILRGSRSSQTGTAS